MTNSGVPSKGSMWNGDDKRSVRCSGGGPQKFRYVGAHAPRPGTRREASSFTGGDFQEISVVIPNVTLSSWVRTWKEGHAQKKWLLWFGFVHSPVP